MVFLSVLTLRSFTNKLRQKIKRAQFSCLNGTQEIWSQWYLDTLCLIFRYDRSRQLMSNKGRLANQMSINDNIMSDICLSPLQEAFIQQVCEQHPLAGSIFLFTFHVNPYRKPCIFVKRCCTHTAHIQKQHRKSPSNCEVLGVTKS